MSDKQCFPQTWQEFARTYTFIDSKEYYTNGSKMIPLFRVEQMMEHYYEPLVAENAILRKMCADLLEEDIKETMKSLDVSDNDFCVRTINDFIAKHKKGEKDVR